jgi:hypothetical protein
VQGTAVNCKIVLNFDDTSKNLKYHAAEYRNDANNPKHDCSNK